MHSNRRDFLRGGALAAAGLLAARRLDSAPQHEGHHPPASEAVPPERVETWRPPGRLAYLPVETPDLPRLPWKRSAGAKEFQLSCEVVRRPFLPWREPFNLWGFNGTVPGPTIEVTEGDRVRFVVTNRLPEATAIHWHGLEVPLEMDGVPGIGQDPIRPGETYVYEFTLHQHGTFFYHSHMAMQEMLGMLGLFVIHPREPYRPRVVRDFGLLFQEWAILPNNPTPNTLAMEFNWLTINGKAGPATTPLLVKQGERVRLRMVNLGMDHHPIHLHGHQWNVVGTEAGRIPESAWIPGNTVLLGVAQARDVEFEARYLGDWMLHCHLPHHMMNHMASMVGPLSEPGPGVGTGHSMERGMGMPHGGHALADEGGPSMGRTLGTGDAEQAVGHHPMEEERGMAHGEHAGHMQQQGEGRQEMEGMDHGEHAGHMQHMAAAPGARQVPGYPQDMFMVDDDYLAETPEYWGLRPTWSGAMMGMMTLVRILPAELYDQIQDLKARKAKDPDLKLPKPPPREAFLGKKLAVGKQLGHEGHSGHEGHPGGRPR